MAEACERGGISNDESYGARVIRVIKQSGAGFRRHPLDQKNEIRSNILLGEVRGSGAAIRAKSVLLYREAHGENEQHGSGIQEEQQEKQGGRICEEGRRRVNLSCISAPSSVGIPGGLGNPHSRLRQNPQRKAALAHHEQPTGLKGAEKGNHVFECVVKS